MTTSWALRVLATVLAVAGVLPLGADADAARYIRIYHISDTPVNIINLMEIEPYGIWLPLPSRPLLSKSSNSPFVPPSCGPSKLPLLSLPSQISSCLQHYLTSPHSDVHPHLFPAPLVRRWACWTCTSGSKFQ
jgi:hypothetical protein